MSIEQVIKSYSRQIASTIITGGVCFVAGKMQHGIGEDAYALMGLSSMVLNGMYLAKDRPGELIDRSIAPFAVSATVGSLCFVAGRYFS